MTRISRISASSRLRTSLAGLLLGLIGFLAPAVAPAAGVLPQELPPLRWAADAEGGAPYIFKDPKDVHREIGFEVDLARALEEELGRRIEFVQYDFKSLISGLQRGDFDLAMNGLEVTPDRLKAVRFSRPYYVYQLQLVARAGEKRFETLEQCKRIGGVVGTLEETAAERLLDKMGIAKKVYDGQVEAYVDLELGRTDGVLMDLPIAVYYAQPNPKLKFTGPPLAEGLYAIAFRMDQEKLAQQFDRAIERLLSNGRLREIYQKWRLWNTAQEKLAGEDLVSDVLRESGRRWSFRRYFPLLCQGAVVTVEITLLSMSLAVLLGMPIALLRLYAPAPLRLAATIYVEFFRGIPVLLLLYFLYYGLPTIAEHYNLGWAMKLGPMQVAVLGFGLNYAAYEAEIYRAGIRAIPVGQWEAAASLGMRPWATFRRIILPQAIRGILPPMTNDLVALFKDTSIVSVIAVVELTKQYQILSKSSLKYLEIGLVTAMLYLLMSVPLGRLSRRLEQRWGKGP